MAKKKPYLEISNNEYRQMEGISSTELKRMAVSPLHYKYYKDNPQDNDTPALLFGRAAHKYILEPYDFFNEFAVAPVCDRRTKEGKEIYATFLKESEGKDVITAEQFQQLQEMLDAMTSTPFAKKLLDGEHEKSFFWTDEDTDIACKCRPDSYNERYGIIVDYKTCQSAEPRKFMNHSIDLNYDLQAAYYMDGISKCLGKDFKFVFIAQEKTPPYAVSIFECSDEYIKSGRDMYKTMLQTYKDCTETDNWYGYMGADAEILSLGVPNWLKNMIEEGEG